MSTKGNRDFRPFRHYAPPAGWINDPNGLVYEDGTWHLFAQHYPHDAVWGPMHWVHATSRDLLTWTDQGIALYPDDKLGMAFSGSGVIDRGNTSGLGDGVDPMVLMYTSHGEYEQQSIAFSNDRVHFTPYQGNPVMPNAEKPDFRDPKVFYNEIKKCWTVIVAAGDHLEFHASDDLIHWRKTGEFGQKANRLGGIYECPDMFPLTAPDGSTVWVLILSLLLPAPYGSSRTQYFLGRFDGDTFEETIPAPYPRILDSGYDNYAAVTFNGADRRVMIGWGSAWSYAFFEPTNEFCGIMTYARELTLVDTEAGLMLAAKPVTPDFDLKEATPVEKPADADRFWQPQAIAELPGELFHARIEAEDNCRLELSNALGEKLVVLLTNEQKLVVDRSKAGQNGFSEMFADGLYSVMTAPRTAHGPAVIDVYFDRMIAEVFMDGGTVVNSSIVFPTEPYTKAKLIGRGKLYVG
ncbi:MAG: glycoside hydrolase family 32 protein [Clostridiales bacterium]|nr:glycoside hydrolase family 32 protein [Clostridiales bacterium]